MMDYHKVFNKAPKVSSVVVTEFRIDAEIKSDNDGNSSIIFKGERLKEFPAYIRMAGTLYVRTSFKRHAGKSRAVATYRRLEPEELSV
jgi:hypothetical protein